jgi:hypothetical protein
MADKRKYHDDEVREILDLASKGDGGGQRTGADEEGLTLAELQEVGLEVGMDPDRIAEAASAVDARRQRLPRRTSLGLPIGLGRIVELPSGLTDHEWDRLVVEFRETFGSRGRLTSSEGTREWTGGDVQARVVTMGTGARVHIQTQKGDASLLNTVGVTSGSIGFGLLIADAIAELLGRSVFTGDFLSGPGLIIPLTFVTICLAALITNLIALPRWAREREGQMEYLAQRVGKLFREPPDSEELVADPPRSGAT